MVAAGIPRATFLPFPAATTRRNHQRRDIQMSAGARRAVVCVVLGPLRENAGHTLARMLPVAVINVSRETELRTLGASVADSRVQAPKETATAANRVERACRH